MPPGLISSKRGSLPLKKTVYKRFNRTLLTVRMLWVMVNVVGYLKKRERKLNLRGHKSTNTMMVNSKTLKGGTMLQFLELLLYSM